MTISFLNPQCSLQILQIWHQQIVHQKASSSPVLLEFTGQNRKHTYSYSSYEVGSGKGHIKDGESKVFKEIKEGETTFPAGAIRGVFPP